MEILALAAHYVPTLKREFPNSIDVLKRPGSYPMVHFLDSEIEDVLHARIIDDICAGRTIFLRRADTSFLTKRSVIRRVLTERKPEELAFVQASSAFTDPQAAYKILLVVRGLIMNRILVLCLGKRWNVQYGLDSNRQPIELAVPFEAKGIPSEQSEFGHPDVAIMFTCLSFYYSGLTMEQFCKDLQHVLQADDPAAQYERWTSRSNSLPEALHHWNIINVHDGGQMEELWKHLRLDRIVINHYMNCFVFPEHARQFDIKLQASSWDIPLTLKSQCGARTTGFSGTNDNRLMLPFTIQQDDLPSLRQTSAEVLSYLLQPRNRGYQVTTDNYGRRLSESDLLHELTQKNIRVLIDAGAYVLEMDNKTLASSWLAIDHKAKAAVYFGNDNKVWVHYRVDMKHDVPLLETPFAENLSECVVYLDQAHTRGVDFKLPAESHGALTLAPKQSKDTIMQAAMRLRQLSTTQCVTFFAPPEVDQSIRYFCGSDIVREIDSSHVVAWLLEQTCRGIEDMRNLHVAQGIDFCRRSNAVRTCPGFLTNPTHRKKLLGILQQPERQTLEQLYRGDSAGNINVERMATRELQTFVDRLGESRDNTNVVQTGALEEVEQQREVHVQFEQVRQSEKPPRHGALQFPGIHQVILQFTRTGILETLSSHQGYPPFEHAFACLARSDIGKQHGIHPTGSRLFVSREFGKSVDMGNVQKVAEDFLRPVEWILWSPSTETALVIIPEEAELLIPTLRSSDVECAVYLIAYAAPVTKSMMFFNTFQYYTLPRLPKNCIFPDWFRIEIGILAGRLYADVAECKSLTRYLRSSAEEKDGERISDEGSRNGQELTKIAKDPAAFLLEWLALRRKVENVLHTPMGQICSGRELEEE